MLKSSRARQYSGLGFRTFKSGQWRTRISALRWLVDVLCGVYALGLALFLALRLLWGDSLWWLAFAGNFTPFYFAPLLVLLPLALVVRARRAALLVLPLLLISVLWFGRLYLPKTAAAAPDAPTLRVVTFNVWGTTPISLASRTGCARRTPTLPSPSRRRPRGRRA
ncbi:MAG: hypothetical protein U0521_16755 [Anaerolineae bacterium]